MNIIDLQESLKDYPDNRLMDEMQRPSGNLPQFLVLGELQRRKRMRDDFKRQEASNTSTVAEEIITGAGVPQEGLMTLASALTPNTALSQDTGIDQAMPMQATRAPQPQMAADGGIMKLQDGGFSNMTQYPFFRDNKLAATYDLSSIAAFIQRGYPREGLVANFGEDAVREAESMILDKTDDYARYASGTGRAPLGIDGFKEFDLRKMEDQGIFGNKSYRDPSQSTYLGGERVNQSTDKAPTIDYTDPQSLQEIDPDLDDFLPEIVGGAVDSPINRPFVDTSRIYDGFKPFDSVPEMALDTPLSNRQIIDSGVGIRGADTDPAQQLAEFLASRRSDLPGVNLPGESDPYIIDPDAAEKQGQAILDSLVPPPTGQQNNPNIDGPLSSALQYYGGTAFKGAATPEPTDEERRIIEGMSAVPEAGAKIETESAPDRSIDRQINPEKYMDLDDFLAQDSIRDRSSDRGSSLQYPTFLPYPTASGAFPNDAELAGQYPQRGGSETVTERQRRLGEEYGFPYKVPPPLREFIDSFKSESIAPKADEDRRNDPTSAAEALQNQEDKIAPKADEYRGDDPLTLIDSVTDGGEGGAGFGSPESEIAKLLSDRRKRADQNKWLALAEAGFAMMGPAATFGEGIGKGGKAGLAALRESQKGLDAFETDMLKLQASMDIADARNQTTMAAAMLRKKNPTITASALTAAQARVNEARDVLANATTQADKVAADAALKEAIALRDEFTRMYSGQIGANIASNTAGTTGGLIPTKIS
tara:strand:+ start:2654 stop:4939 length:2286 start_codon:yes stop_codon:yes gene_type:complete